MLETLTEIPPRSWLKVARADPPRRGPRADRQGAPLQPVGQVGQAAGELEMERVVVAGNASAERSIVTAVAASAAEYGPESQLVA